MSAVEQQPPVAEAKLVPEPGKAPRDEAVVTTKETSKTEAAPFSNYWRILSHRTTADGYVLLLGLLCGVGSGTAMPLMNIVFGNLVGDFNGYFLPNTTVTEAKFKSSVNRNALYIVYLFIGKFVLTYVSMFCFRTTGLRVSARIRLAYLESLFAQSVEKLDSVSSGSVANTITTSANTIQMSISDKLYGLFMSLALTISAFAIAFRYSWAVTLVCTSALVFIFLTYSVTAPYIIKGLQKLGKANEAAASTAGEIFSSIRAVFSLNAEKTMTKKYFAHLEEADRTGFALSVPYGLQFAPIFFAMYSNYALAFWFGLKLFREGHISNIGTVVTVFFSVMIVIAVLGVMVAPIMEIQKAVGVSTEFFSMIDSKPVKQDGVSEPDVSAHDDIELRDVSFAYPTRPTVQVLKGFSARFETGKTTALVGPSGSGKSTIVALLERWYELGDDQPEKPETTNELSANVTSSVEKEEAHKGLPSRTSGVVSIGGRDINEVNLKWWRSKIGLVQQEPFLFNDTILNNVAFGLIGTNWEHEDEAAKRIRVEKACQEAFADEFIQQLPEGYLTKVGESGIKLSGGQRQRLAIARSIIREPAILILDEATSSIDVRGERIVQKALDRVSRDRTTIVIAHRLSTIRKADKIIVMREGCKVEEGTHQQLLSMPDGLYASLVRAQQLEAESAPDTVENEDEVYFDNLERKETTGSLKEKPDGPTSTYKAKGFFRSFGRFIYEQRRQWVLYLFVLAGAAGAGASFSIQSYIFAHVVEVFRLTGAKMKERGDFWSLMFFILALGVATCYFIAIYCANNVSVRISSTYKKEYFQNILRNPVSFFDMEENASGSLMSRLSTDPKQVQDLLGLNGIFPIISIFNITGCVAIAFTFGWKLTVVTFFSAMPVIFIAAFVRIRYELEFEKWNSEVFSHSSQFATEAIGAFRTVTALTMEDSIVRKYSDLLGVQIKKATFKATYAALVFALSDSVELCAMALTFWYGGQLLASREYNPTQFFVIYVAIIQGAQGAGQFLSFSPNISQATAAANRILGLRQQATGTQKATSSHPGKALQAVAKDVGGASIKFTGVTFKYPTRDTPIYRNLSFSMESGQFVAFVGPSGCGKTTVISLLERFYEPLSGTITFNGVDIRDIELSSYRRAVSLVAQEPKLFDGTIRENLVLGLQDPDDGGKESASEERIIQACKDAEIHDFIISLPDGYDTALGINTQTSLSGGQKQRLCLARALLRDPSLLLLDEATSSLDSQSEKLVQGAIERLVGQRSMTVVAVAHRLATIRKADVIFVFGANEVGHGSRILEHGTHYELVARRGIYWQMCQEQALDR
ncbi:ABC multidrug transporter E [Exophiala dermatitidis]